MNTNKNKFKNVITYCRTSSNLQADNFSIDGQTSVIKDYCRRNNFNIINSFVDECKSGTTTKNRIEYERMIYTIKNIPDIHAIVIYKLSRISRNMTDLVNLVALLEHYNVNLISIEDNIDTSTPMGKTLFYLIGAFAEMDRENIISNCKMGMKERAVKGLWNGGRMLGYKSNSEKQLKIVDSEAEIVKLIFNLFAYKNLGYKKIACYLNERGYKTLKNSSWAIHSIRQIVNNPTYIGYIRWGQYLDWSKKRRKGKNTDCQLFKGQHTPIIDMDTWEKAQAIIDINKGKFNKLYEGDFILTGLLRCPKCGASMISHRTKKRNKPNEFYRYYQCSNFFNKGKSICTSNLIHADVAEKYVLTKINEIISSNEVIDCILKKINLNSQNEIKPLKNKISSLENQLSKVNEKRKENLQLQLEDKISFDILNTQLNFLKEKEDEILPQLTILKNDLQNISLPNTLNSETVISILNDFTEVFYNSSIAQKKTLLKSIIESISIIDSDNIKERVINKIKFYFEPVDIVQAQKTTKKFATTCDTVHHSLFQTLFTA
ncbi:recombinase family protein [Clostridium botulinum]|uniref:recombinase family protein n=1 Tax=Clostridium botulinum TaxID=1491 RepID=UPI0007743C85|nr:recombinase family protein [Clostridium botulinum]